jgi:hypothetical protein
MSDPFDLPERELPEHVRRTALRRIMTEIGHEPPRRKSGLVPLLIAASVVVLMAGATIVATTLLGNDHKVNVAAPRTTTSTSGPGTAGLYGSQRDWATGADLDRCAINPPQGTSSWTPLLRTDYLGVIVVLYRQNTNLYFCQLTQEQTTIKSIPFPDPPTGNEPAKILFITPDGTWAGVTAPGIDALWIRPDGATPGAPVATGNGVFILPNTYRPTDQVRLHSALPDYDVPKVDLPQSIPVTTKSSTAPADRSTPAGQRLAGCLSSASTPAPDGEYFAAGAYLEIDATYWIQVGRRGNTLIACQQYKGTYTVDYVYFFAYPGLSAKFTTKLSGPDDPALGTLVVGILTDPKVAGVGVTVSGKPEVAGVVADGTAIAYLPAKPDPSNLLETTAQTKDAAGSVIENIKVF